MTSVTLPPDSPHIVALGQCSISTFHSLSNALYSWLTIQKYPVRYEKLFARPQGPGAPARETFLGFRFHFDTVDQALMFKLAWGGQ